MWPASWSNGKIFWLMIMRPRFRFPVLPWGFFLGGEDSHGDHGLGSLVGLRFKAPPGTSYSYITIHLIETTWLRLMGVPTSEVGYTSTTTGKGDHEVHKGHVVALGEKYLKQMLYWLLTTQGPLFASHLFDTPIASPQPSTAQRERQF
jgi:hypothetical protein